MLSKTGPPAPKPDRRWAQATEAAPKLNLEIPFSAQGHGLKEAYSIGGITRVPPKFRNNFTRGVLGVFISKACG